MNSTRITVEVTSDCMEYYGKRNISVGDVLSCEEIDKTEVFSANFAFPKVFIVAESEGFLLTEFVAYDYETDAVICRFFNEDKATYPNLRLRASEVDQLYIARQSLSFR